MYLNTKSEYCFLHSLIKLEEYIAYGQETHQAFISICDTNTTFGCYKFIQLSQAAGLKPVVGMELSFDQQQLFLFAKNINGLKRLYKLNTQSLNHEPLIFDDEQDLICVIGQGLVFDQVLNHNLDLYLQYQNAFDNIYLGVDYTTQARVKTQLEFINKQHIKIVNISTKNYLYQQQINSMETLLAISKNTNVSSIKHMHLDLKNACVSVQIPFELPDYSLEIANLCHYNLEELRAPKPNYPFVPAEYNDIEYLYRLALKGLRRRLDNQVSQQYIERLNYEIKIINELGYASYFLIVWDIVKYAKEQHIMVGPSRGSAAGCLVAYCIGITQIDPIKHNLLFERFLNPKRQTMPDIDLDFEDLRRNEIYDYIAQRFGSEHVCKIGTLNRFLAKSTFRDVAKANGLGLAEIDKVSKCLNPNLTFSENLESNENLQQLMINYPKVGLIIDRICDIEGLPRQMSIHAAGVIIAANAIDNYCAVNDELVSLEESKELEAMGLLKMDILALSNLTFIRQIVDDIHVDDPSFDLNAIDLNDKLTYKLLQGGMTLGVFQVDSIGMRDALRTIKPQTMDDIALVLALYRPGPKDYIPKYHEYKKHFRVRNDVDKILAPTSGIIMYQEQIMLLAQVVAGYDLGKADILRRGVSKKNKDLILSMREDFIKSGVKRGYDQKYVEQIFDHIEKFANYGFNKAHAYGYGLIVYQMAFLKAHYPHIFYARLFYYTFKSEKRDEFLHELDIMKIQLLPPSILYSSLEVNVEPQGLRMGLLTVRGIGLEQARALIKARQELSLNPSLEELLIKVIGETKLSPAQVTSLVDAGAFDFLNFNHRTLNENFTKFCDLDVINVLNFGGELDLDEYEEYSIEELSSREHQALDINLTYDLYKPLLNQYQTKLKRKITLLDNIVNAQVTGRFLVLVHINMLKDTVTKHNEPMCFLQVSSKGIYDVVVFPKVYSKSRGIIHSHLKKYLVLQVNVDKDQSIIVENVYE